MELTKGDFVTHEPLLVRHTSQMLRGDGMGYGSPSAALRDFIPQSRTIAEVTFSRGVLTRRKARLSAADPQDDAMSAVVEVHADGAQLRDFGIWLNCDYTNDSPLNCGDDVDAGLFVGCRTGVQVQKCRRSLPTADFNSDQVHNSQEVSRIGYRKNGMPLRAKSTLQMKPF
jgi:hypothetical protein